MTKVLLPGLRIVKRKAEKYDPIPNGTRGVVLASTGILHPIPGHFHIVYWDTQAEIPTVSPGNAIEPAPPPPPEDELLAPSIEAGTRVVVVSENRPTTPLLGSVDSVDESVICISIPPSPSKCLVRFSALVQPDGSLKERPETDRPAARIRVYKP